VTTVAGAAGAGIERIGARVGVLGITGVAVDRTDTLYVTGDFTLRKVTAAGDVTTLAGGDPGSADGTGATAKFSGRAGVALDGAGNLYIADVDNDTIRKVSPSGVVITFAGVAVTHGSADGTGAAAQFFQPTGVAVDRAGNLFVTDTGNHTIRKVSPMGEVTTFAGVAGMASSIDGVGAGARFSQPAGMVIDGADNLYVADTGNSLIRKVTPAGEVTTLAGVAGVIGIVPGPAPRFAFPAGLAILGDALVVSDGNAVLLLRHVVQ
jgi:sugar lactone lactonase YvrE